MSDKKIRVILYQLILIVLLTGCWDKVEINERAFVSIIGIDKYIQEGNKIPLDLERFEVTYVYPNLMAIGKNAKGTPIFSISDVGNNLFEVSKKLTTTSNKTIFLAHTKAIILGEELLRNQNILHKVLDGLSRDPSIGRKANVLIAKGKVKELLTIKADVEPMLGVYISELLKAKERGGRFLPITLGDLLQKLHNQGTALMPVISSYGNRLRINGSGIVKNYELAGYLNGVENESIMILLNKLKSDEISFRHNGTTIPYIITDSKAVKKVEDKKEELIVTFNINLEGYIEQYKLETDQKIMEDNLIKVMEKEIEARIKKQLQALIKKIQVNYNVDIFGVGEYLKKYKPSTWDRYEDDWNKKFQNIPVRIEVNAKIRRIGMIK
ncbi:Ger(x)C family spore germination protein [Clostridiaceae bacterium M8S5]|nr:Ger(x)C family spore germination protein [Clostridiaceae bacterium M8S5]